MAVQHGIPGEWARVRGSVLSLWPLFTAFVFFGAFLSACVSGRHTALFAVLFALSAVAVAVLWRKGVRRVTSFFVGARGEERVANLLASLPDDYHVFHDFVARRHHVDHVVVGPAGVFSVETKNWRGRVCVEDGQILVGGHLPDRSPLKQTVREADAVKAQLAAAGWTGSVTPVLCFASDTLETGRTQVGPAFLVNAGDLVPWLTARAVTLAPDERDRLVRLVSAL